MAGVAGNPLALVELAGELTPAELSGAVPLGWPLRFGGRLGGAVPGSGAGLPADAQTLLAVAAADPTGDPALGVKAAGQLGAGPEAGGAAGMDRLVSWEPRVRFRHPLIRWAAYYAAPAAGRARAAALAAAPTPALTRTGGPGTWPRPRQARTRRSPRNLSAPRARRRPAAGWLPPRRSWNVRPR